VCAYFDNVARKNVPFKWQRFSKKCPFNLKIQDLKLQIYAVHIILLLFKKKLRRNAGTIILLQQPPQIL
jgi:hypothetical protein